MKSYAECQKRSMALCIATLKYLFQPIKNSHKVVRIAGSQGLQSPLSISDTIWYNKNQLNWAPPKAE